MVTEKEEAPRRGRPPGTGSKQALVDQLRGWRIRAEEAESKLYSTQLSLKNNTTSLEQQLATARKEANVAKARLQMMHDTLQGAIRGIMGTERGPRINSVE